MIQNDVENIKDFIYPKEYIEKLKTLIIYGVEQNILIWDYTTKKNILTQELVESLKHYSKELDRKCYLVELYDYEKPTLIIPFSPDKNNENIYIDTCRYNIKIVSSSVMNYLNGFYRYELDGCFPTFNYAKPINKNICKDKLCLYIDNKSVFLAAF